MLAQQARAGAAQQDADREHDEDRVVELAGDRDEVGDQVDRRHHVGDHSHEQRLAPPVHARVGEQSLEEHDAVRDQADERPRVAIAARHEQRQHQRGVQRKRPWQGRSARETRRAA